jgi:photosystem II stability/assembly factor-like uncharacterized protein
VLPDCLRRCAIIALITATAGAPGGAQPAARGQSAGSIPSPDTALLAPYVWRNIGPNRGGRSIAVAGSPSRPNEYFFGATGGGLWKTTDGGTTWAPVTDGQLGSSSVGAVAVAASRPDVVYLGMGEAQLRGNVMQGDGVYRSDDGGRTWVHRGLGDTQAIARIRVHPTDPEVVYVAALGHPFAPNDERGCVSLARRWANVGARAVQKSARGCRRSGHRSVESTRAVRDASGRCIAGRGSSGVAVLDRGCTNRPTAVTRGPS